MALPVATQIDEELCIGCGTCVKICPDRTLSLLDGKARVTGTESLQCGHCAAVCPEGAIQVTSIAPDASTFNTIGMGDHKEIETENLVMLMRMRRSCRNYKDKFVNKDILEDLAKIGASAPSGTNSQRWNFFILANRASVLRLGDGIAKFFKLLNKIARNPAARVFSRLTPGDQLGKYYREYYDSVTEAMDEWESGGKDRLFHGAHAAIIISSSPGASCPKEDAMLAAGQIVLAAEAMRLGTCLIGFAVEAMKNDPRIKRALGIPKQQKVYAVIAIGHPSVKYPRPAGRLHVPIKFL